nr:MAG: polyprotein [Zhejiang hypo-like virus]
MMKFFKQEKYGRMQQIGYIGGPDGPPQTHRVMAQTVNHKVNGSMLNLVLRSFLVGYFITHLIIALYRWLSGKLQGTHCCYRHLVDFYCGNNPYVSLFLFGARGRSIQDQRVSVTFHMNQIHIEPDDRGILARVVIENLRHGYIPVTGPNRTIVYLVPWRFTTRIGGRVVPCTTNTVEALINCALCAGSLALFGNGWLPEIWMKRLSLLYALTRFLTYQSTNGRHIAQIYKRLEDVPKRFLRDAHIPLSTAIPLLAKAYDAGMLIDSMDLICIGTTIVFIPGSEPTDRVLLRLAAYNLGYTIGRHWFFDIAACLNGNAKEGLCHRVIGHTDCGVWPRVNRWKVQDITFSDFPVSVSYQDGIFHVFRDAVGVSPERMHQMFNDGLVLTTDGLRRVIPGDRIGGRGRRLSSPEALEHSNAIAYSSSAPNGAHVSHHQRGMCHFHIGRTSSGPNVPIAEWLQAPIQFKSYRVSALKYGQRFHIFPDPMGIPPRKMYQQFRDGCVKTKQGWKKVCGADTIGGLPDTSVMILAFTFALFNASIFYWLSGISTILSTLYTLHTLLTFAYIWLRDDGQLIFRFMGSHGDKISPLMYYRLALEKGFTAQWCDASPSDEGKSLLNDLERGHFLHAIGVFFRMTASCYADAADGNCVISNWVLIGPANIIAMAPTAALEKVRAFRIFHESLIARPFNYLWWLLLKANPPDIQLDSSKWNPPRSANGYRPLVALPNLGSRRNLVCLGSSGIAEPDGLDPAVTWSTNPDSRYQYESRTNHEEVFREYAKVYCHGGAGTVATAKAAGCDVVSLSNFLDRDITDAPYFFHDCTELAFVTIFKKCDLRLKFLFCPTLMGSNPLWAPIYLGLFLMSWVMRFLITLSSIALLAFSISWAHILTGDVASAVSPLFQGDVWGQLGSLCLAQLTVTMAKQYYIVHGLTGFLSKYVNNTVNILYHMGDLQNTILFKFSAMTFGLIPTMIIILMIGDAPLSVLTYILMSLGRMVTYMQTWFRRRITYTPEDGIFLVFQPMHGGIYPSWMPLYHTEFLCGSTHEVTGTTMDKSGISTAYTRPYKPSSGDFYVRLGDENKWPEVLKRVYEHDNRYYCMFSNCQVTAHHVLTALHDPEMAFYVTICILMTTFMMVVFGIPWLITTAIAFLTGSLTCDAIANTLLPHMVYAGAQPFVHMDWIYNLLRSIFQEIVDGSVVVADASSYPRTDAHRGNLCVQSLRQMILSVQGKNQAYMQPMAGMSRPEYTYHRDGNYINLHGITDEGLLTKCTPKQREMIDMLSGEDLPTEGIVAVLATSGERPISPRVMQWVKKHCDDYVILTNAWHPDPKSILLPTDGRTIACLRLAMPATGATWVSLNAAYCDEAFAGLAKLRFVMHNVIQPVCVSAHGLNPGPAGLCAYRHPIIDHESMDLSVYGAEEVAIARVNATVHVRNTWHMFNVIRHSMRIPISRRVVLYDNKLEDMCEFTVSEWSVASILDGLHSAQPIAKATIGVSAEGLSVNGKCTELSPIVSDMYPSGTTVEDVMQDFLVNAGTFSKRATNAAVGILEEMSEHPMTKASVRAMFRAVDAFSRDGRPPKALWAPVHNEFTKQRSAELGVSLHPNPVFVHASFEDTLSYYVKHLNCTHNRSSLSPTEFRRRVNRSPYVDTWLREKLPEAHETGVDASVIACREVMLESLARYNKGGFADAMTDTDIKGIVEAIYNKNPDMFSEADIADPLKLTKRFLSFKKYSAGLPFTYVGSDIRNRADLRKAGWLRPIAALGLDPYVSGRWYPAISHAFPKSQVVSAQKIWDNPAKMRSIVATAGFNNVQQGVLNFDVNNRHNYMDTHEKVAMPLLGSYMNYVFSDLEQYKFCYSLDVTAMDANLSNGVLQVVADLRKKGYEQHPLYEIISKHIDCAMEQTKHAYVINLINDRAAQLGGSPLEVRVKDWSKGKGEWAVENKVAPGGILHKTHGGSTGDSNVTFNNTKALPVIVMYCYCKAAGIDYDRFFDEVALHNFGDDDLIACDSPPDVVQKMVAIAKEKLGVVMRFESQGTDVLSQTFLGKQPVEARIYADDFRRANIPQPRFAILNNRETMLMRLSREKAEMTRHKGDRHELYRLEKAMGYASLTAHQEDVYDLTKQYFDEVVSRLPPSVRSQAWFKKKYKLPSYEDVIRKWYRPLNDRDFGLHKLQMEVHFATRSEAGFLRICSALNKICDWFPAHLVANDRTVNAYRTGELYSGIFEAHAWHNFIADHGMPPTLPELEAYVGNSPYSQFTNCAYWLKTVGSTLPTEGPLFERNHALSTWKVIIYTGIYLKTNTIANQLGHLPFGNAIVEFMNLALFKSRRLFGSLGYTHYVFAGKGSPMIDALVPKDPFAHHKRAAVIISRWLPGFNRLGFLPVHKLRGFFKTATEWFAATNNTQIATSLTVENVNAMKPWLNAWEEAKVVMATGATPLLVAHTGTGKTRHLPGIVLSDPDLNATCANQVIVVMPRNIICEQWSKVSGAVFKKKRVRLESRLMTCTYGYLAHCYAEGNHWWSDNAFFIFDEAHEESVEWVYLRKVFMQRCKCIALTATPAAQTCINMTQIEVDVKAPHPIEDCTAPSLDDAIGRYCPKARRFLIIEPSLRKCQQISARLTATGYPNKVVHSGARDIPDGLHIVATSVIEAAITIPHCDLVIDTGERIVNDGGTIRRVPNDKPGSIQRRGRTGRTNPGVYVCIRAPVNRLYPPVPEINGLLSGSPITEVLKVPIPFDRPPRSKMLLVDKYAMITDEIPRCIHSVSLMHQICLAGVKPSDIPTVYENFRKGVEQDEFDHLTRDVIDTSNLQPYDNAVKQYRRAKITYKIDNVSVGPLAVISNHKVGGNYYDVDWEGTCKKPQLDTADHPPVKRREPKNKRAKRGTNPRAAKIS